MNSWCVAGAGRPKARKSLKSSLFPLSTGGEPQTDVTWFTLQRKGRVDALYTAGVGGKRDIRGFRRFSGGAQILAR